MQSGQSADRHEFSTPGDRQALKTVVHDLAGAWPDFPDVEELRISAGLDRVD